MNSQEAIWQTQSTVYIAYINTFEGDYFILQAPPVRQGTIL